MKYKITYLIETSEHTEDTPVMDLGYWTNFGPSNGAEQMIRKERPDLLKTQILKYKGLPLDEDWQAYQSEVLDIQGDIVNWEEVA